MDARKSVPVELPAEPIPLITLRVRRGGPLPAFINLDVLRSILDAIQQGAWDYVACQAAGVPKTTFEEWMRRGRADRDAERDTEYSRFSGLVERARARAQVDAEILVFERRPDLWLLKGPGRATPSNPEGWGSALPSDEARGPIHVTFDIVAASGGIGPRREPEE